MRKFYVFAIPLILLLSVAAGVAAAGLTREQPQKLGMPTSAPVPPTRVNLDEIKEEAVRRLFDDQGRMINPDWRLARIAEAHEGGFGGYYFDREDRGRAYVFMLDPAEVEAARAAFREAYGGDRTITSIVPVQGGYAFNDLLRWFGILYTAFVRSGIPLTSGAVQEIDNRIHFGIADLCQVDEARRIMDEIGVPPGAVVFRKGHYGFFPDEGLRAKLRSLAGRVEQLIGVECRF